MTPPLYQWRILQKGQLPLQPSGDVNPFASHVCTATLIWPVGEKVTRENSVLVDPCFSRRGQQGASKRLADLGASFASIGFHFTTHDHFDHALHLPEAECSLSWHPYSVGCSDILAGLTLVPCPGHHPQLRAVRFSSEKGEVWVVSDAILNGEWLRAWGYYWPNGYSPEEIVQTWRSVASILASADRVIPGHGLDITVDAELLQILVSGFPQAAHADRCPDVLEVLTNRLARLGANP